MGIDICSSNGYGNVSNFEWYVGVLCSLSRVYTTHGRLIAFHLMDVLIRVKSLRSFGVAACVKVLNDSVLVSGTVNKESSAAVLQAAAWCVGEFCSHREALEV